MNKILKITLIVIGIIILINILFWLLVWIKFQPIYDLYDNGIIIRLKPLHYAMVFAHGFYGYECKDYNNKGWILKEDFLKNTSLIYLPLDNLNITNIKINKEFMNLTTKEGYYECNLLTHYTWLYDSSIKTKELIDSLKLEGYDKIWVSMCSTGNHKFMEKYSDGKEIEWYDYISRKESSGNVIPIFIGFGFIRL